MLWFHRLNLVAGILCFCIVVFGAFVRLSDAGLGCPDWPGCYGQLTVPEQAHEVARAQAQYPQRPVEAPKAWKEMIHRYLVGGLSTLIVVLAVLSRFIDAAPRRLPFAILALLVFQALLGMWTVTWKLMPLVVTGHLLGGMTTFALLLWMWLAGRYALAQARAEAQAAPEPERRAPRNEREAWTQMADTSTDDAPLPQRPTGLIALASLALGLLALQIYLGGWTSSNYAALACPDLPTCQGHWLPPLDIADAFRPWRGLGISYEHGVLNNVARMTIHFFHRCGALLVTFAVLLLAAALRLRGHRRLAHPPLAALGLQLLLGISIVLLRLPLPLAVAHNAGAALLLAALVWVNFQLRNPAQAA